MVHGREGFTIGDLVKVRYPSQLHPPGSPGMPGVYRITSGPRTDGTYQMLPTVAVHPQTDYVRIHGYWLMPVDDEED